MLLNLGGNAVKFTQHGEISLELHVVESSDSGTTVRCDVRDTGIGIPPDRVAALFAPFTQVDTSTTRKYGGTGLGLSIVRRLVDLMDGDVSLTSELGTGSTFSFTVFFPAVTGSRTPEYAPHIAVKGRRALVVDDNSTHRRIVLDRLVAWGIDATGASSTDEALALLRQGRQAARSFDLAFIDQRMPNRDGVELARAIVRDDDLRSTRLVLMTLSGQHVEQVVSDLGFAAYISKPVLPRELLDCLEAVCIKDERVAHRAAYRSAKLAHDVPRPLYGKRILLAEDNLVNQKVAVRLLEKLNYRVDVVGNGRAAVNAWRTGDYDLILMDCQMPELDGYEATREIRSLERGSVYTPIVALTAHAMKGAAEECKAAGMDGYLSKPIDQAQLATTLALHLDEAKAS